MTLIDKDKDGYEELHVFDQLVELISKMTDGEQEKLLEALKKRQPELRGEKRAETYTETIFTAGGKDYNGAILDLSRSGLFMETDELFSIGQEIFINWKRPQDAKIIKVRGWIARAGSDGIGVQFYQ
jgi:hypothetical protein